MMRFDQMISSKQRVYLRYSCVDGLDTRDPIREGLRFELRLEANNAMNHPIFGNPATDMNNPVTFGTITSASDTRTVNISGKFRF